MLLTTAPPGSCTARPGFPPAPYLHDLQSLVPIGIPVKVQWVPVLGIGNLYGSISHLGCLDSLQYHIPTIQICLLNPGGGSRVLQPDLNFTLAIRARGSNWGFVGRGSYGTGTSAGTLNISTNGLSSSESSTELLASWHAGSSSGPMVKLSMSPAASVSVLMVVEAGVAPSWS